MVTTAGTTPTEVKVEIETELADADITDILDRVERDIDREYDSGTTAFEDTQHRVDFEAAVAAYRIGIGRDPRTRQETFGEVSFALDESQVAGLRARVHQLDPRAAFARIARRNDARTVLRTEAEE